MVFNSATDFGSVDYRQLVRCLKILDIELHAQLYRYFAFCCRSLYAAKCDKINDDSVILVVVVLN